MELINRVCTEPVITEAYSWLCKQRKKHAANNSVWDLRFHWDRRKTRIRENLLNNTYHLSPLKRFMVDGQSFDAWEAQDALVLKAITIILSDLLAQEISQRCYHVKAHGGARNAVLDVCGNLSQYKFVYRSDIKSYYRNIDHKLLIKLLEDVIADRILLRLLREYCRWLVWVNGDYELVNLGISKGCSLSPLIGAWYLNKLDVALTRENIFYARFMDDWIILAKHPQKTFIGRIERGFDFLGYHFNPEGLSKIKKLELVGSEKSRDWKPKEFKVMATSKSRGFHSNLKKFNLLSFL